MSTKEPHTAPPMMTRSLELSESDSSVAMMGGVSGGGGAIAETVGVVTLATTIKIPLTGVSQDVAALGDVVRA